MASNLPYTNPNKMQADLKDEVVSNVLVSISSQGRQVVMSIAWLPIFWLQKHQTLQNQACHSSLYHHMHACLILHGQKTPGPPYIDSS